MNNKELIDAVKRQLDGVREYLATHDSPEAAAIHALYHAVNLMLAKMEADEAKKAE